MARVIQDTGGVSSLNTIEDDIDLLLGQGSYGAVYSLKSSPIDAVKEVQLDGLSSASLESLKRDITYLPRLSHPGIIKYKRVVWHEDLLYIFMERYNQSLDSVIKSYKRKNLLMPIERSLDITHQLASALAYLHSAEKVSSEGDPLPIILHRDLRPANVLTNDDVTRVVITDFGLCKDSMASSDTTVGTPLYAAPEVVLQKQYSPASDIWSLGVIVYELAVLKKPNFLEGKEPKDVFIDGWKPDLSAVEDDSIRIILEKIFVLDPVKRPTARSLQELLNPSISSMGDAEVPGHIVGEGAGRCRCKDRRPGGSHRCLKW